VANPLNPGASQQIERERSNQTPFPTPGRHTKRSSGQVLAFAMWNRTWTFAQELQEHFGVKHTLLGPPHLATLPEAQATRLSSNLTFSCSGTADFAKVGDDHVAYPPPYPSGEEVTVQEVRACTWPACILVGCSSEKLPDFEKGALLEGFISHARDDVVRSSTNTTKLVQGLKQSFALVAAAVKAHPCLKYDFQVFIRSDGRVLGIDLDRCFKPFNTNSLKHLKQYKTSSGTVDDARSSAISLSNAIELPEPSRRDWSPGGQPRLQTFCRRGSEQRRFDKALDHLYERLNRQIL